MKKNPTATLIDAGVPDPDIPSDKNVATVSEPSTKRTTVNLPPDSMSALKMLAAARHTSVNEVIRQAIDLEKYFHVTLQNGGKVLVEEPDKPPREIVILR